MSTIKKLMYSYLKKIMLDINIKTLYNVSCTYCTKPISIRDYKIYPFLRAFLVEKQEVASRTQGMADLRSDKQ